MLLYKYRSFDNFEYIADILLNERLYCAEFSSLNDPCEGFYLLHPPPTRYSIGEPQSTYTVNISDSNSSLFGLNKQVDLNRKRVCSLSAKLDDIRLWSFYAGNHTGIAIEIEIDAENHAKEVKYRETLPWYMVSLWNPQPPAPEHILRYKFDLWVFEEEHRIITDAEYFPIQGKITKIYLGSRIDTKRHDLLKKLVPSIPIIETQIDPTQPKIIF